MNLDLLTAISPIDGRYRGKTEQLANYFSEYALIRYRVRVEIEYFIKEEFDKIGGLDDYKEFIHFGLTSQDINNTSVPLSVKEALEECFYPQVEELIAQLQTYADEWKDVPMLAKTHGQPASPTRLGKEIVAHILAAQFPLPGCHALFRQHIACQRCAHFQLPAFAVRFHSAVQHTVHTAIAQLVVHPQAIVLPAVTKRCFGQGHCLKYGLR